MSASTLYFQWSRLAKRLPLNFDDGVLDEDEQERIRAAASREVDADLRAKFIPFNDIESDARTPDRIENLAMMKGRLMALEIIIPTAENSDFEPEVARLREMYSAEVDALLSGKANLPESRKTGYALTFGTGGSYDVETWQAKIAEGITDTGDIPTIILSNVRVSSPAELVGYRFGKGRDFWIRWSTDHRCWIFEDYRRALTDGATIDFDWTYVRYTDQDEPAEGFSGLIQVV